VCQGRTELEDPKDLRAGIGKFPNSTNERIKMSKKTIKQRIAVVAVSALTAGVLSVMSAPVANAADAVLTLEANAGVSAAVSNTAGGGSSTGVLSGSGAVAETDTASVLPNAVLAFHATTGDGNTVVTVSGGTIGTTLDDSGAVDTVNTARTLAGDADAFGFTVTPNSGATSMTIRVYDAATATSSTSGGTLVGTLVVSIGTVASIGAFSAADSYVSIVASAVSAAHASNSDTANENLVPNGTEGIIALSAHDGNGTPLSSSNVITATATNGAVVAFSSGGQLGASSSKAYGGTYENIYVAQGTANKGITTTVTVSVDGVAWTSKTFVLYGAVNSIAIGTASVGQKSATGAFYLEVRDDNNQLLGSVTPTADSTLYNSSVTAVTPAASGASAATAQAFTCSAIVGTAKIQYYLTNAAAKKIVSNILDVSCAGDPYTWTASLDKASYAPGDIATLTIQAKDSKGLLTNETVTLGTASSAELVVSGAQMTAVSTPTNSDKFSSSAGTKTYKFTVGTTEGSYNMVIQMPKWSGGANSSAVTQGAVTVPYKVASATPSVSNADVLKSIVSLIASINKQIQALQKLILQRR
jgi:hypothetical protein